MLSAHWVHLKLVTMQKCYSGQPIRFEHSNIQSAQNDM